MKRFYGIAAAFFLGLMAIALAGGESKAVAGHGCCGGVDCSVCSCSCNCSCYSYKRCCGRRRCFGIFRRHRCHSCWSCHSCHSCHSCYDCHDCCGGVAASVDAEKEDGEAAVDEAPDAEQAPDVTGTSFRGTVFRN